MNGYLAEIRGFAANFSPRTWSYCSGQIMAISSNQALFSLIGTIYGGDGRTSFALPDLRGRTMVHQGVGPGLSPMILGSRGGREDVTLTQNELPTHTHTGAINVVDVDGPQRRPGGRYLAADIGSTLYSDGPLASPPATLNTASLTIRNSGSSSWFYILNPLLVTNKVICISGMFPSRN